MSHKSKSRKLLVTEADSLSARKPLVVNAASRLFDANPMPPVCSDVYVLGRSWRLCTETVGDGVWPRHCVLGDSAREPGALALALIGREESGGNLSPVGRGRGRMMFEFGDRGMGSYAAGGFW